MAIIMNGFSTNPMGFGTNTSATQLWLYDTVTGLNVAIAGPSDFSASDFSATDFAVGLVEYQNLSQKPGTNNSL